MDPTFLSYLKEHLPQVAPSLSQNNNPLKEPQKVWVSLIPHLQDLEFPIAEKLFFLLFENTNHQVYWSPSLLESTSNLKKVMETLEIDNYQDLYQWSIEEQEIFWLKTIERLDIHFYSHFSSLVSTHQPLNPSWFKGAKLNIVDSCLVSNQKKPAIIFNEKENGSLKGWSYEHLHTQINKIANGLINLGLKKGARITIYSPLIPEAVAFYLGVIKAGMIVVSVADSFTAKELEQRMTIANSKHCFLLESYSYREKVINLKHKTDNIEGIHRIILGENIEDHEDTISFDQFLGDEDFNSVLCAPYDYTNILFSSGTTKAPKAIPWTHLTPIKVASDAYYHQDIKNNDIITWTTGMGWMMAPWMIYASFINGATLALYHGDYTTSNYGAFIQDSKTTILGVIPSLVKKWKENQQMEKYEWNVRLFSSTGEPSNPEDYLYLAYLGRFKAPIIEYCGGTEIGGGYLTGAVEQDQVLGCFSTPTLGTRIAFPKESENEVYIAPPALGLSEELLNRSHNKEYYNHEYSPLRRHGDLYEHIPPHYFRSKGRADDTMNLGGIKISSIELESIINKHHDIKESAAIGYSNNGPQKLFLFVVGNEKNVNLKAELQHLISTHLNPQFRISELIFKTALPKTSSNKLMRRALIH